MARKQDWIVFMEKFDPILDEQGQIRQFDWINQEDLAKVKEQKQENIWTVIDGEKSKMYIIPGYHFINRLFYIITNKPWKEGQRDYLY